ncbi:MAG: phospholipase [Gammaproteobacteria bacterium]|nr:phospholipase [Gammaproteobacteria bacterium]
MKKIFIFLCLCVFVFPLEAAIQTPTIHSNFELIESVPKDTIYGQPHVRRTQTVWLDMLNEAKKTIDLGAFYLTDAPHSSMDPVIFALKKAAERGVKVRIILDGAFYDQSKPTAQLLEGQPNITIRVLPMNALTGGVMHAKYFVVDDEDSFVGSSNFDWRALDQIHEIGVRIRNRALAQTILQVFNLDWALCETKDVNQHRFLLYKYATTPLVTVENPIVLQHQHELLVIHPAFSPKSLLPMGVDWELKQFVQLMKQAQHQILMQVLVYSPAAGYQQKGYWATLDNAIRAAAGRGVHLKLIVSNWALKKPGIDYLKSLSVIPNVEIKYSLLPLYQHKAIQYARVEHCKYMVIDHNLSWVGTGNWQWGYFYDTRNIAIIIKGSEPNKTLHSIFFRDWFGPYVHPIKASEDYSSVRTH